MKGYIEIQEDSYEDTIEHLHRIKVLACKLIKMLTEHSEGYDEDGNSEETTTQNRTRKTRGRYNY